MSLSQSYCPSVVTSSRKAVAFTVLQIIGASLFIALCAQIRIPLPFTPVPITCQTVAVMLIGALLGSKKGALAVLLYLAEAAVGLPVLAEGNFGIANLIGVRGGYLAGFVAQSYLIGKFFESQKRENSAKTLFVLLLSSCIDMGLGVLWLAHFVGLKNVMLMGFYPFIPGEVVKAFAVTLYLKSRMHKSR
jgi:biotin transport system substrate-specific component